MTPSEREARVELRSAILRSRMTPAEIATAKAVAAGHPSTYRQVPDSERGGAPESAVTPSPPPRRRDHESPCIEWTGSRHKFGYGRQTINGRVQSVHRLAWENKYGAIPVGMYVLHHCDNPPCYNVDHLFLGTHLDNMRDMVAKGRGSKVRLRGEAHPRAKLTSAQVAEIRSRYAAGGISEVALSRFYDVGPSQIDRIVRGLAWGGEEPFTACHATVTSINVAADRLRALKGGR